MDTTPFKKKNNSSYSLTGTHYLNFFFHRLVDVLGAKNEAVDNLFACVQLIERYTGQENKLFFIIIIFLELGKTNCFGWCHKKKFSPPLNSEMKHEKP